MDAHTFLSQEEWGGPLETIFCQEFHTEISSKESVYLLYLWDSLRRCEHFYLYNLFLECISEPSELVKMSGNLVSKHTGETHTNSEKESGNAQVSGKKKRCVCSWNYPT